MFQRFGAQKEKVLMAGKSRQATCKLSHKGKQDRHTVKIVERGREEGAQRLKNTFGTDQCNTLRKHKEL